MLASDADNKHIILESNWKVAVNFPTGRNDSLRVFYCREGSVSLMLNQEIYAINSGDMLVAFPGDFLSDVDYGKSFAGSYLFVPQNLLGQFSLFTPRNWNVYMSVKKTRLLHCDNDDSRLLQSYINLFEARAKQFGMDDCDTGLQMVISVLVGDFIKIIYSRRNQRNSPAPAGANRLFNKFIKLLYSSTPHKHTMEYYADKLCITPKYLSVICKHVAGETASSIINRFMINEIRNRLADTHKSIKTIGYELGFANQSVFGKYVKTHLGMTPSQYRECNKPYQLE